MFLNIQETSSSVRRKMPSSDSHSTSVDRKYPTVGQLWSVMEFSRQFPELTLYLVADLKATELAENTRIQAAEPLEFPPLIAPDPRELRAQVHKKEPDAENIEEEIALFAAGELPPPVPLPPVTKPKEKKHLWHYLLTLFTLILILLWLHDSSIKDTEQPKNEHLAARQ